MSKILRELVRNGKLKQPTAGRINSADWYRQWIQGYDQCKAFDPDAEELFSAGKLIRALLDEISAELKALMGKRGSLTNDDIIRALCASSNRNRAILSAAAIETTADGGQPLAYSVTNTAIGNELSMSEVADGSVDMISKACFFMLRHDPAQPTASNPLEEFSFVRKLMALSQLYENYESFWHALVWSDYRYMPPSKAEPFHSIKQTLSAKEMAHMVSHERRQKLWTQEGLILSQMLANRKLQETHYIIPNKSGRRRGTKTRALCKASGFLQSVNREMLASIELLTELFPPEFLSHAIAPNSFTISQAFNVYRLLSLLAIELEQGYPKNYACDKINDLRAFSPSIDKMSLSRSLASVMGVPLHRISEILTFLTYSGTHGRDLWCHPLILYRQREVCLLSSALASPNIVRVAEHWFSALGKDLSPKGSVFEKRLLKWVNTALAGNTIITDYNEAATGRFRYSTEEEIDLLVRIGETVLVVEAKSIVTTDSPISQHRSMETLQHAAAQATRKADFVRSNASSIAERLNWPFDTKTTWQVIPAIAVSNRDHVGFAINGVPVVDDYILRHYMVDNTFPLLSTPTSTGGFEHAVYFQLYDNQQQAEQRLESYLKNPPQILSSPTDYELTPMRFPVLKADSVKVQVSRWLYRGKDIEAIVAGRHPFPIKKVDNWRQLLDNTDVFL